MMKREIDMLQAFALASIASHSQGFRLMLFCRERRTVFHHGIPGILPSGPEKRSSSQRHAHVSRHPPLYAQRKPALPSLPLDRGKGLSHDMAGGRNPVPLGRRGNTRRPRLLPDRLTPSSGLQWSRPSDTGSRQIGTMTPRTDNRAVTHDGGSAAHCQHRPTLERPTVVG